MIKELSINLKPSKTDLNLIKKWLSDEYHKVGKGFFLNGNTIENSFEDENLITLNIMNQPIGFIIYYKYEIYAYIEILYIHQKYRETGLGKKNFEEFSKHIKAKKIKTLKLNCAPITSKGFWEKMGFKFFPQRGIYDDYNAFFKVLVEVASFTDNQLDGNVIELWNKDYYDKTIVTPNWTWSIELDNNGFLKIPIIFPCDKKWHIKWKKNGNIIKEDMARSFYPENNKFYGDFLYITSLSN